MMKFIYRTYSLLQKHTPSIQVTFFISSFCTNLFSSFLLINYTLKSIKVITSTFFLIQALLRPNRIYHVIIINMFVLSACLGILFVSILCMCCSHFLVLFYFLYYVLYSRFFPNALILFFIQFCYS